MAEGMTEIVRHGNMVVTERVHPQVGRYYHLQAGRYAVTSVRLPVVLADFEARKAACVCRDGNVCGFCGGKKNPRNILPPTKTNRKAPGIHYSKKDGR